MHKVRLKVHFTKFSFEAMLFELNIVEQIIF